MDISFKSDEEKDYQLIYADLNLDISKVLEQTTVNRDILKLAEGCSELSAAIIGNFVKTEDKSEAVIAEMADVMICLISAYSKLGLETKRKVYQAMVKKIGLLDEYKTKFDFSKPIIIT